VIVARLPRHEAGERRSAALGHVEPPVLVDRRVPVGVLGHVQQVLDGGALVGIELPLDLEAPHDPYRTGMARPRSPKGRARETFARLADVYPGTVKELCELDHENAFQLTTATILSAQTTDVRVNMVTPELFRRWPDPEAMAEADTAEMEAVLQSTGFYRQKTKSVQGMARRLLDEYGGEVPHAIEDLVTLPGVGRKTANVIRSVAMDEPGLPVDTHVLRLSKRLGLTAEVDPVKVERDLNAMLPPSDWGLFSERVILHGRRVCDAKKPRCDECVLNDFCPSAFKVGPLPKAARGAR
jgi:endonuclease-3